MPLYSYLCKACEHEFEQHNSMLDMLIPTLMPCPKCAESQVTKTITGTKIVSSNGDLKAPAGFRDVMGYIHKNNRGSKIDPGLR